MIFKKNYLIIIQLLTAFLVFSLPETSWGVNFGILNAPLPEDPCPPGSSEVSSNYVVCRTTANADNSGVLMFGPGAKYTPGKIGSYVGKFTHEYAPLVGMYTVRMYICPVTVASKCTINNSANHIDSARLVNMHSTSTTIANLKLDAGGPSRALTVSYAHSTCITLVDSAGTEWSSNDGMSCSDGAHLPEEPAACYFNFDNSPLNVDMGVLERSKIATAPLTSSTIKKSISVLCTRSAGTDVNLQFQYTSPTLISGEQLIDTKLNGLGIAVIYDGKVVKPSDKFQRSFTAGYSQLDIELEAVRDPNLPLGEIGTGKFSANAVLLMTEQ